MVLELSIPLQRRLRGIALVDSCGPIQSQAPVADGETSLPSSLEPAQDNFAMASPISAEDREVLASLGTSIKELSLDLRDQQRQRLAEMQRVAVELAITVASRLVHDRIEAGDFAVENLVRQIAERLESKDALTLFLHPSDVALLQERLGDDSLTVGDDDGVRVIPDPSLKRGDCRAETGDVHLVLELDKQLEEMRRRLLVTLPEAEVEQRRTPPADRALRRYPDRRQTA